MDISSGIFFGTIAMLSWGTSDFFIAKSVRGCGVLRSFIWAQATSVILLTLIFIGFYELPSFTFRAVIMIITAGSLGVISNLSFYKSLRVGQVSIVMPIASCWAIITVILSFFFWMKR